jgi:hypothetical protein
VGKAIAPMVARVATELADPVAERVSRVGREDAVDRESVAGVRVDNVVSHDPHVLESREQALRTVPHAWRSFGCVVVEDSVRGDWLHD